MRWLILCLVGLLACETPTQTAPTSATPSATTTATATTPSSAPAPSITASAMAPKPRRAQLSLIAGGDIFFGRVVGQVLLSKPTLDPFEHVQKLLDSADLRFGNLECQLSDQKGVTVHPENHLVFTGPPGGADVLKRSRFDIVSLANNHMWDFGKDALWETYANLERVGIQYVGSGRDRKRAYGPVFIERDGFKLAFVAVTDIWNMGPLSRHKAREFVARADPKLVKEAVEPLAADDSIDAVIVSYHGGSEYMEEPTLFTRKVVHAAVDAGADIVIGHHPHVAQGISWYGGKPVLYSLGNFTMGMNGDHPWSRYAYLARITFKRGEVPAVEACPFLIHYFTPIPLSLPKHKGLEDHFFRKLKSLSKRVAGSDIGPPGADGCAPVTKPEKPFPGAIP